MENPLRKVDISAGDVKRQVANTVRGLLASYRFQSMGEYRALLSLYNIAVEEPRGVAGGCEYHGLVYAATDDAGNKAGNPSSPPVSGKAPVMKRWRDALRSQRRISRRRDLPI